MSFYDIQGNYLEENIEEGFRSKRKTSKKIKSNQDNKSKRKKSKRILFGLFKRDVNEGFLKTEEKSKKKSKKRGFFGFL